MEPRRYFLCSHVFLCVAARHVVILDIRRDRYACIPRQRFDPLIPWLDGWSSDGSDDARSSQAPDSSIEGCAAGLVSQGILTADPLRSKPVRPMSIVAPEAEVPSGPSPRMHSLLAQAPAFFVACHRADSALSHKPFEAIIRAAERRRQEHVDGNPRVSDAVRLVRVFAALRLWYPRPYLCTFDSLALLEFLALNDHFPSWVFGVRAEPFYAHCWVQLEDVLLNDRIEQVIRLAPILAV